jgi:putative membrane-bound dehydrogenase-like protein
MAAFFLTTLNLRAESPPPKATDKRLVVELVAKEPEIVTPTGIAVDEKGRIWVVENNTHERPADYKGASSDRIRVFEDFDKDGKARKISTFAEGFKNAMSIALSKRSTVYLATRSEIYRMFETKVGSAEDRHVIVKLDTPGKYPHNGLSGFAFDAMDNMYFSLGENLGAEYELIGSDGTTLKGGGEGGSIYRCGPDGTKLTRIATGFWNTFHLTFDAFGRLFAVDNDPDSRGPCRLLHIVEGGDYGYRFRNGRKGLHPFTAWNGELPGTLPMVCGTAEAPSGIVAYESTGLPKEYVGQLLTTSWGDHVVERFKLEPKGASFTSQSQIFIQGGEDFRPVGIAVGPDGSLYLSDWVDKSYPVHGKGRIWRVRMKEPPKDDGLRPSKVKDLDFDNLRSLFSHPKKEIRQAASEAWLQPKADAHQEALAEYIYTQKDVRGSIHGFWAAAQGGVPLSKTNVTLKSLDNRFPEVRFEAIRLHAKWHKLVVERRPDQAKRSEWRLRSAADNDSSPLVRFAAISGLLTQEGLEGAVHYLADKDPFLVCAALNALGKPECVPLLLAALDKADADQRLGILIALRRASDPKGRAALPKFLADADPAVRRAAIQWVGEERLKEYAPLLKDAASKPPVTRELFEALLASNAFLSGAQLTNPNDEVGGEEFVAKVLSDPKQPTVFRTLSLRMLRPDHPSLTPAKLKQWLDDKDQGLRTEAIRTLIMRPDDASQSLLRQLAADEKTAPEVRAQAVLGLAHSTPKEETQKLLFSLLSQPPLQREVLRSLRGLAGNERTERTLLDWWKNVPDKEAADAAGELVEQIALALRNSKSAEAQQYVKQLMKNGPKQPTTDADWQTALAKKGDPIAGERVFFHSNGPRCYACHRVDGRGTSIGPDLSTIARATSREKLIESILTPSKEIAPRFTSWLITTKDGKVRTGVIVEEGFDSTVTVADSQGKLEVLNRLDIEDRQAVKTSIMPDNLKELMTQQEFRDLLAYLQERK